MKLPAHLLPSSFKILIASIIFMLIHLYWNNSVSIWSYIFSTSGLKTILANMGSVLIFGLFSGFVLALFFSISILLGKIVILSINFIASVYSYYAYHFGIQMSDELMMSMLFYADRHDVLSSFDWTIFVYVPLLFMPSYMAVNYIMKKFGLHTSITVNLKILISIFTENILRFIISIIFLFCLLGILYIGSDIRVAIYKLRTIAEQAMPSYIIIRKKNIKMLAAAHKRDIKLEDYSKYEYRYSNTNKEPIIVVLIIGEALRSDRLGINGYERDTTPYMKNMKNLFSFKDVLSCSTTTAVSLPCMLTNEPQEGWIDRFKNGEYTPKYSLVKVFTDLGFDTKWLSAANKDYGIYISKDFHGASSTMLSSELRRKFISKENDFGDLLLAKAIDSNITKNTFYVLGTMGSHRDYFARYTEKFSIFKPDIGNSLENINNAYDNTVVYFDNFIYALTEKLKNKNAIIFYASDHGESLGENGIFLHGAPVKTAPKKQRAVPMIVWTSDKFAYSNPKKLASLNKVLMKNLKYKYQLRHDHLFHSILDCAGILSEKGGVDSSLSICSDMIFNKKHN